MGYNPSPKYTVYGTELIEDLVRRAASEDRDHIATWFAALLQGPELVYHQVLGNTRRRAKAYVAWLCDSRYIVVYTYAVAPVRLIRIIEAYPAADIVPGA